MIGKKTEERVRFTPSGEKNILTVEYDAIISDDDILTGSEKQIAWAKNIRAMWIESANKMMRHLSERMMEGEDWTVVYEQYKVKLTILEEFMRRKTDAGKIIDMRTNDAGVHFMKLTDEQVARALEEMKSA